MKIETRVFNHKCELCGEVWTSEQKADQCPGEGCGHWHMTLNSEIVDKVRTAMVRSGETFIGSMI